MKKLLVISMLFGFSIFAFGCGIITVQHPVLPTIPHVYIEEPTITTQSFQPPAPMNLAFIEKDGRGTQTIDNVLVRVASITDHIDDDSYTTTIEGPDESQYKYNLFPMMLVLEIKNKTDHIIRLTRTIIHIEDENQVEYPLINSFGENKKWLASQIGKAFDEYIEKTRLHVDYATLEKKYLNMYSNEVYNGGYPERYKKFVEEIEAGKSDMTKEGVRTPDIKSGHYLNEYGIRSKLQEYAPATVYSKGAMEIKSQLQQRISSMQSKYTDGREQEITRRKNNAILQIMNLPNVGNLMTGGKYLPISILPGRTKIIIAPISKRFDDEKIKSVIVNVFDLPTKVNAAGDPIKRANFKFHFIAERI